MSLTVRPEKAPPTVLEWRLLVLPFQLTRPADKHWGTWLESFPPVGGLRGPERRGRNTPAEEDRLVRADLADYRDHGFDLAMFNYYFGVKENPDGSFTYDISTLAQDLEYWKTLGSATPGGDRLRIHLPEPGVWIRRARTRSTSPAPSAPRRARRSSAWCGTSTTKPQRRGWPKLYFYPIDEPGNNKTENRMLFAENVLDFVHEVPGCQTATTVGASDVQRLGDRVDVRIYAYGHYNRNKVLQESAAGPSVLVLRERDVLRAQHARLAQPGRASSSCARGPRWPRPGASTATKANPYNDFDGGHKDWNVIFPGVDKPTPTIYWELCREGVDDCRYVATLQQQIRQARAARPDRPPRNGPSGCWRRCWLPTRRRSTIRWPLAATAGASRGKSWPCRATANWPCRSRPCPTILPAPTSSGPISSRILRLKILRRPTARLAAATPWAIRKRRKSRSGR